jgi:indole-3-glycerol phosphate synthase
VKFLDHVVAEKQRELAAAKSARPAAQLLELAQRNPVRDFHAAVSRPGAVIAELKARTPTIASFPHSGSLCELSRVYADNGAPDRPRC